MIQIILDGKCLNEGKALDYVPTIGSRIVYKTFRENTSMTKPVYDRVLMVEDILYETQETWNGGYSNKIVKVFVKQLSETQIR